MNKDLKTMKTRFIIGSIAFGVIMGWRLTFTSCGFRPSGLIMMLIFAVLWGIPVYYLTKRKYLKAQKNEERDFK